MPKLREVIEGTKTKFIVKRCVLAALQTIKLGLTEAGNQAKPSFFF